jgi:hypothetical protein
VNEAATNIENARGPVVAVTAPNGSGRDRGRTLDCSARPGRNPSCTEPPKSRFKESAKGSVARGVLFAAFVSASVTTLILTRETFSWKPFRSKGIDTLPSPLHNRLRSRCLHPLPTMVIELLDSFTGYFTSKAPLNRTPVFCRGLFAGRSGRATCKKLQGPS